MIEIQPRYLHPAIAPDAPALYDPRTEAWLAHGALAARVDSLKRTLVGPRALAFLFCRSDVASVIAYMAAVEAGHAVALLDAHAPAAIRQRLIAHYQPEWILEAGEALHNGDAELAIDDPLPVWRTGWRDQPAPHPDLAVLLTTSGSTGSPKFVRLSRRNLESNAAAIRDYLGLGPGERAIASLPMSYAYGLSVLNSHLLAGASVVLTEESVLSREFWQRFDRTGCTSFAGVPYTYEILDRIGFERQCPAALRTMTQAGGRLDPALTAKFHALMAARGGRFFTMYGQTEAAARIAYLPADRLPEKLGSAGIAVPGGTITIERGGRPVKEPGQRGEVVYRGPNVSLGYASCREELSLGDERQGRLATGDEGYLDAEGFLYLTGRLTRYAKLFGLRVSLDEVEAMLRPLGPTAVVDLGDRLGIACEHGDDDAFPALGRSLASALRLPLAAFRFRRLEALPLLPTGKIDYARLKELIV